MDDDVFVDDVLKDLEEALRLLRELRGGESSLSWGDSEFRSRFRDFADSVISQDGDFRAFEALREFVMSRFAVQGKQYLGSEVKEKFEILRAQMDNPVRAQNLELQKKIVDLRNTLVGLGGLQEVLEKVRSGLLALANSEKSSTLNVALEDLESCFISLAGEVDIDRAVEDLESCKSQLKRYVFNLPPSGIVPLEGDAMILYRALRNAGSEGLTKQQGMDILDCSESHFFDCLSDVREVGIRVDVEGEGSAERRYVYQGR